MKILNFGSLNIDDVYAVDHFVRPGETISTSSLQIFPGGKGLNQSVALGRAGAQVCHAGAVGTDGLFLLQQLQEAGVDTSLVQVLPDVPTGHAIIQVDKGGQNAILLFGGSNQAITPEMADCVLESFEAGDWLLLQNEINQNPYIIQKACEKGMKIAWNPSPMDDKIKEIPLHKIALFFVNEIEGREMTGEEDPEDILHTFSRLSPNCQVVLTLGRHGAMAFDGTTVYRHGIYPVAVEDTTAAGDTFTGFYLASQMAGDPIPYSLELASKASSIAVSRKGASVSIPTLSDVKSFTLQPK